MYRSQSTEAEQGEFCTGHRGLTPPTPNNMPKPHLSCGARGDTDMVDDDPDRLRRSG